MRRELGDFQTPPELAAAVLECLGPIGRNWSRVLEPTCGRGHFIAALLEHAVPPREILAVEIQDNHCAAARAASAAAATGRGVHVRIHQADFFGIDLRKDLKWRETGRLLVVGNPPWVTSAELGRLESSVRPPRRRIEGLDGFAALDRLFELRRRRGRLAQAHRRAGRSSRDHRPPLQNLGRAANSRASAPPAAAGRKRRDSPARCGAVVRRGRRCLSIPG